MVWFIGGGRKRSGLIGGLSIIILCLLERLGYHTPVSSLEAPVAQVGSAGREWNSGSYRDCHRGHLVEEKAEMMSKNILCVCY